MKRSSVGVSVKGRRIEVPAYMIGDQRVVVTGQALKIASIHDEDWSESPVDPETILAALRAAPTGADLFTFAQEITQPQPKYQFRCEMDNAAAIPLGTFEAWWEALPQETRKNVRRGEKRGVTSRIARFDAEFIRGIKAIYDETPVRQGRKFWHFGKDLKAIEDENRTYLERSDFVAAYFGDELIGFIKIVYVGRIGRIMQIISKNAHADKRPPNILLAKAVEACIRRGMTHFVYGKYHYGNKGDTSITEFKRRNGFQRLDFPRYYVPLTMKGRAAVALRLHRGIKEMLPAGVTRALLDLRARMIRPAGKTAPENKPPKAAADDAGERNS